MKTPKKPDYYIVSTDNNPAEIDYGDKPTSKSTQSKVKESKVEESKEKETEGFQSEKKDFKTGNGTDLNEEKLFEGEPPSPDDSVISQMWQMWKATFPKYTADRDNDFQGLGKIHSFMCRQGNMNNHDPTNIDSQITFLNTFQAIADEVAKSNFWENKPLKSIAYNIQEFYNKLKNPSNGNGHGKQQSTGQRIDEEKLKSKLAAKIAAERQSGH